jgi:hypothetical protein
MGRTVTFLTKQRLNFGRNSTPKRYRKASSHELSSRNRRRSAQYFWKQSAKAARSCADGSTHLLKFLHLQYAKKLFLTACERRNEASSISDAAICHPGGATVFQTGATTHICQSRSFHPTARRQHRHDQNPRAEHQWQPGDQFVRANHFERHRAGKFFAGADQLCHQRRNGFQLFPQPLNSGRALQPGRHEQRLRARV